MGVTLGRGGVKYEDLFRQADSALYTAKTNGKIALNISTVNLLIKML